MQNKIKPILDEMQSVIVGKQDVVEKLLISIFANGHILLDDVPGVGKTTMAVAVSRVLGLKYKRVQFTPDVLPSDITGFSIYNKQSGKFEYMPGAAAGANILLGDEINRTSSKTQSALLEAMEEGQVTVDGETHALQTPFIVIATQNNVGAAGTQILPYAQLDRFLVKLSIGYPDFESQIEIMRDRQKANPIDSVKQITDCSEITVMQSDVLNITVKDSILEYIARLAVTSRENEMTELGISPRGAISICRVAKARAYIYGRDYVIPEDIREVFIDVCAHRIIINQKAKVKQFSSEQVLRTVLDEVKVPDSPV
jgi:MoxR-like ATPase